MHYITDTHAFLWYLNDSPQISQKAKNIFQLSESGQTIIVVPIIVLLETLDILEKKKVKFDFDVLIDKILKSNNYIIQGLDLSLLLEVKNIRLNLELHDRVIAATARVWDAKIITRDSMLRYRLPEKVIW